MRSLAIITLTGIICLFSIVFFYTNQPVLLVKPTDKKSVSPAPTASADDLKLAAEKKKVLAQIDDSEVYFAALKTPLETKLYQVDIYLSAKPGMKVDAADLIIKADKNLIIKKIKKGQVFANYPRLINEKQTATITGIAKLGQDQIVFGEPNQIFTSLLVEKIRENMPAKLLVDQENTKVFLNGKPVLNKEISFNEIIL
jgi:hypothetical protein